MIYTIFSKESRALRSGLGPGSLNQGELGLPFRSSLLNISRKSTIFLRSRYEYATAPTRSRKLLPLHSAVGRYFMFRKAKVTRQPKTRMDFTLFADHRKPHVRLHRMKEITMKTMWPTKKAIPDIVIPILPINSQTPIIMMMFHDNWLMTYSSPLPFARMTNIIGQEMTCSSSPISCQRKISLLWPNLFE